MRSIRSKDASVKVRLLFAVIGYRRETEKIEKELKDWVKDVMGEDKEIRTTFPEGEWIALKRLNETRKKIKKFLDETQKERNMSEGLKRKQPDLNQVDCEDLNDAIYFFINYHHPLTRDVSEQKDRLQNLRAKLMVYAKSMSDDGDGDDDGFGKVA